MKRKSAALISGAVFAALMGGSCAKNQGAVASGPSFHDLLPGVKIVYSANIDGEIEPCGCRSNPTGGIHRRWNLIEQKFQGEKLSLDSGDLFYQSTPAPPFLEKQWNYQASILLKAYNAMGVEAFTPGELDFAAGFDQFEQLRHGAKFKFIAANLYKKGQSRPYLDPYVILTKGSKKVAIFGIYDESLPLPQELEAKDHLAAAQEMVTKLRGQADILIALTHEGLDKDEELAKKVSGIDAIFGAHTQSFLSQPEKVGDTLIFQTSFRGQHVGCFADGKNGLYQVDDRFESPSDNLNPMDRLLAQAKTEIARINKENEEEMMTGVTPKKDKTKMPAAGFQTFAKCAECHVPQYGFYKTTAHSKSFETLVHKNQSSNLDCLKCHTVGFQKPGGWTSVNKLVLNAAGKPIDADSFAKSLPNMDIKALGKISKAYINVQCENCHGAAPSHPFSGEMKKVASSTCLQCHTAELAPTWYKNGKPDQELIATKLKSISCPAFKPN